MPVADDIDDNSIARNSVAFTETESSDEDFSDLDAMLASVANQTLEKRQAELLEDVIADLDCLIDAGLEEVEKDNPVTDFLAKEDNPVTVTNLVSILRDAAFRRQYESLRASRLVATSGGTSVSAASHTPFPPSASASHALSSAITYPFRRPRSNRRWWRDLQARGYRTYRGPASWRNVSEPLRAVYAHEGLLEIGKVFSFTVRLRTDIEELARSKPSALAWLQKRVAKELRKAVGAPVSFYLTAEADGDKALHIHGELALAADLATDPDLLIEVRRALRLAAGEWEEKKRQFQVKMKPDPDDGWTSYAAKDFRFATPFMRKFLNASGSRYRITFPGPVLSITADLNRRAEAIYKRHSREVVASLAGRPLLEGTRKRLA